MQKRKVNASGKVSSWATGLFKARLLYATGGPGTSIMAFPMEWERSDRAGWQGVVST